MNKLFLYRNVTLYLIFFLNVTFLFGQTVDFFPAGQTDGDNIYNIGSTNTTNGPFSGGNAGGIWVSGSDIPSAHLYDVKISFDGAGAEAIGGIGSNSGNSVANGTVYGGGRVSSTSGEVLSIYFSHAEIVATTGYPGTVDGINMTFQLVQFGGSAVF